MVSASYFMSASTPAEVLRHDAERARGDAEVQRRDAANLRSRAEEQERMASQNEAFSVQCDAAATLLEKQKEVA